MLLTIIEKSCIQIVNQKKKKRTYTKIWFLIKEAQSSSTHIQQQQQQQKLEIKDYRAILKNLAPLLLFLSFQIMYMIAKGATFHTLELFFSHKNPTMQCLIHHSRHHLLHPKQIQSHLPQTVGHLTMQQDMIYIFVRAFAHETLTNIYDPPLFQIFHYQNHSPCRQPRKETHLSRYCRNLNKVIRENTFLSP